MGWSLVVSTKKQALSTDAIDTTGANLIVVFTGWYASGGGGTLSDSKGNTWTQLTLRTESGLSAAYLWYCINPTVGSGHTFSFSGGSYRTIIVGAFSATSPTYDQESGSSNGSFGSASPGSMTPAANDALWIVGLASFYATIGSTPTNFTLVDALSTGTACATGLAYEDQATATARNPSWNYTGSYGWSCCAAVFLGGAGGGGAAKVFIPAFCRGGNG